MLGECYQKRVTYVTTHYIFGGRVFTSFSSYRGNIRYWEIFLAETSGNRGSKLVAKLGTSGVLLERFVVGGD